MEREFSFLNVFDQKTTYSNNYLGDTLNHDIIYRKIHRQFIT